jgi:hypothetical protein
MTMKVPTAATESMSWNDIVSDLLAEGQNRVSECLFLVLTSRVALYP